MCVCVCVCLPVCTCGWLKAEESRWGGAGRCCWIAGNSIRCCRVFAASRAWTYVHTRTWVVYRVNLPVCLFMSFVCLFFFLAYTHLPVCVLVHAPSCHPVTSNSLRWGARTSVALALRGLMSCRSPPSPSSHISLREQPWWDRCSFSFFFVCLFGEEKEISRLSGCQSVRVTACMFRTRPLIYLSAGVVGVHQRRVVISTSVAWKWIPDLSVTTWSARIYRNNSFW